MLSASHPGCNAGMACKGAYKVAEKEVEQQQLCAVAVLLLCCCRDGRLAISAVHRLKPWFAPVTHCKPSPWNSVVKY